MVTLDSPTLCMLHHCSFRYVFFFSDPPQVILCTNIGASPKLRHFKTRPPTGGCAGRATTSRSRMAAGAHVRWARISTAACVRVASATTAGPRLAACVAATDWWRRAGGARASPPRQRSYPRPPSPGHYYPRASPRLAGGRRAGGARHPSGPSPAPAARVRREMRRKERRDKGNERKGRG